MKNERDRYILREEYRRFVEHCNTKYTLFWRIVFNAGLRISEAISISTNDILWDENKIIITTLKRKNHPKIPIILPENLMKELKEYIISHNIKGKIFNFSRQWAWRIFKQTCIDAGLNNKYSPHSFRHGHALVVVEATNGNILAVKDRLRHASINSTQWYLHISESKQKELIKQIEEYMK